MSITGPSGIEPFNLAAILTADRLYLVFSGLLPLPNSQALAFTGASPSKSSPFRLAPIQCMDQEVTASGTISSNFRQGICGLSLQQSQPTLTWDPKIPTSLTQYTTSCSI